MAPPGDGGGRRWFPVLGLPHITQTQNTSGTSKRQDGLRQHLSRAVDPELSQFSPDRPSLLPNPPCRPWAEDSETPRPASRRREVSGFSCHGVSVLSACFPPCRVGGHSAPRGSPVTTEGKGCVGGLGAEW